MADLFEASADALVALSDFQIRRSKDRARRREIAVAKRVAEAQYAKTTKAITKSLAPVFQQQIRAAADELNERGTDVRRAGKSPSQQALSLTSQIFNPLDWRSDIINHVLPPMAQGMIDAMLQQFRLMGVELGKSIKASTASEWLESREDVALNDVEFTIPGAGDAPTQSVWMQIHTDFPEWMLKEIEFNLADTFAEDYWDDISESTSGDITRFLDQGLKEGWSINRMAAEMVPYFEEHVDYAKVRAKNIARTESGHALNAARSLAIDDFTSSFDEGVIKVWLSVLGSTTRALHANLDGMPADEKGGWILDGVWCRWPSDTSLPAKDRCNCQCTVNTQFGVADDEADSMRQDYLDRTENQTSALAIQRKRTEDLYT